ncbi:hypothetical protein P167DRAFT_605949 [Morchella conica CCBAS932]|uniref:Azaphilone pigments biosynthesis cluster protein L N-terminal domain-containing protein n=1 Tax=Morchella conica CCBAS932 TaxID=1392247 RepID=A0A3N4KRK0_9PEZI|nr:hypothetical protein P167DRAFT_605949 [Morchella conica CCBAS932]
MEGLGAAASVIAVLQITTQVASLAYVYGYTTGVKRAPTNLQGLIDELKSLVKILSSLQSTAQHSSSAVLGQLFTPLLNYSMEMKSLNDKLEAKQKKLQSSWWGASFVRLQWPLTESETVALILETERFKQSLNLALNID